MPNSSGTSPAVVDAGSIVMDRDSVLALRHSLHELGNVLTGVMIAGGLLSQYLEGGSLQHYAADVCEGSARGCFLLREIRSRLMAANDTVAAAPNGSSAALSQEQ